MNDKNHRDMIRLEARLDQIESQILDDWTLKQIQDVSEQIFRHIQNGMPFLSESERGLLYYAACKGLVSLALACDEREKLKKLTQDGIKDPKPPDEELDDAEELDEDEDDEE